MVMKTGLKIYVFPADTHGCGYYRLIWPAEALQRQGHNVVIIPPNQRGVELQATLRGDTIVDVMYPPDADVIVLQRVTHKHLIQAIKLMRERGVAVVIDMDDDLANIHPSNPAFTYMHPKNGLSPDHNWQNAQKSCDIASLVTVSTPALLDRYARHGRGHLLRNCVPEWYLDVPRVDSAVIGWAGSLHSHPRDMDALGTSVSQLIREGAHFRVIGPPDGMSEALGLGQDVIIDATGARDLQAEWPESIATLGVGIAPLADTVFNAAKSRLKPLEYAALGVPCVMSPRADYRHLHQRYGVGLLASKPRQWLTHLRTLTTSSDARDDLSGRGREAARELTIEANAWRWLEAWSSATRDAPV